MNLLRQFRLYRRSSADRAAELMAGCFLWLLVTVAPGCGIEQPSADGPPDTPTQAGGRNHPAPRLQPPARSAGEFVGSAACEECHPAISQAYSENAMANSLQVLTTSDADAGHGETVAEFATTRGISYAVERDGNRMWHHERRDSASGREIYDQRVAMDIEVGSGTRGRSYLYFAAGRLFQSPVSWYAQDDRWDLSPGYARDAHHRFERQVTHGCLSCHAGRVNVHPTETNCFSAPPVAEESIGCERCHGPGKAHVEYRLAGGDSESGRDPLLNPSSLDGSRRDAVCNQCHLAGKRRVLRFGRTEFDFRPGMHLSDVWVTFLKTEGVREGVAGAVSQVEQMYQSRCYQNSETRMTCVTCHDPHGVPARDQVADVYRQRCLQCHDDDHTPCSEEPDIREQPPFENSCIACHMPRFEAADVHAAQTDHRIRRFPEPPEADIRLTPPRTASTVALFDEPGARVPQVELDRARGIYLAERGYFGDYRSEAEEAIRLLRPILDANPDDIEGQLAAGQAYRTVGRTPEAIASWNRILELSPRHEEALDALATARHEAGRLHEARKYYERLVEVNPARSRYFGRLAHVLGQLGEFQAGIRAAGKALELDPSLVQTHAWLANVYQHLGRADQARHHAEQLKAFGLPAPGRPGSEH